MRKRKHSELIGQHENDGVRRAHIFVKWDLGKELQSGGGSSVYARRNFLNGKRVFSRIVNDPQPQPSRNAMQRLRLSCPSERVFICFYIYLFPFFCPCFCSIIPPPSSFIRQRVVLSSNVRLSMRSLQAGCRGGDTKLFDWGRNERSVLGRGKGWWRVDAGVGEKKNKINLAYRRPLSGDKWWEKPERLLTGRTNV